LSMVLIAIAHQAQEFTATRLRKLEGNER